MRVVRSSYLATPYRYENPLFHRRHSLLGMYIKAVLILALFCVTPSEAFTDSAMPPSEKIWQTDAVMQIEKDSVSFEIDNMAKILLNIPKLKRIKIEYSSEGNFKIEYITYRKGVPPVSYKPFVRAFAIRKGEGEIVMDLRHTENWGIDSQPVLIVRGNGKLKINKLFIESISPKDGTVASQKDSGFFWMPERYSYTSANSITPVFWSYSDKIYFTSILGAVYAGVLILTFLFSTRNKSINFSKSLPIISALFALLFMAHYAIRFYPALHAGLLLTPEEKRERYYMEPELGISINAARKNLDASSRVIVLARGDDWYAKESICFNIHTIKCTYYPDGNLVYHGLSQIDQVTWEDADAVISYNSEEEPDFDYHKVWELNNNVFIGIRR